MTGVAALWGRGGGAATGANQPPRRIRAASSPGTWVPSGGRIRPKAPAASLNLTIASRRLSSAGHGGGGQAVGVERQPRRHHHAQMVGVHRRSPAAAAPDVTSGCPRTQESGRNLTHNKNNPCAICRQIVHCSASLSDFPPPPRIAGAARRVQYALHSSHSPRARAFGIGWRNTRATMNRAGQPGGRPQRPRTPWPLDRSR